MGSGRIKRQAPASMGLKLLQQQKFMHEWSWELTIVGNLQELLEDI